MYDRDDEGNFGGLARESFGGLFFVDSPNQRKAGIRDSVDLAKSNWYSFAEFGEHDSLPKQWANNFIENWNRILGNTTSLNEIQKQKIFWLII